MGKLLKPHRGLEKRTIQKTEMVKMAGKLIVHGFNQVVYGSKVKIFLDGV